MIMVLIIAILDSTAILTIWTFRRADLQISIPRGNCYLFPINYGYKYEQLSQG